MNVRHRFSAAWVALFVVVAASAAQAHHSFSGAFDVNRQIALKGVISKIDWVNPHVYLYLDVKDNDGGITTWAIESLPTNHLRSAGITKQDLWNNASAGEVVTVNVYQSKDVANHRAGWLLRITYADGHFLHLSGDPKEIIASNWTTDRRIAMRHRFFGLVLTATIAAVALCIGETRVAGQQVQRARTGAPAVATPRSSDGHPDLSGYWYRRRAPIPTVRRSGASVILDSTARDPNAPPSGNDAALLPGTPKYKPEFLAKVRELDENQVYQDPAFTCGPPGVPRIGPPQRIVQTPREIVLLYDDLNGNFFRLIPTDGRPHRKGIEASAHGDSVGRWEGDTLVIDVRNLSADTWLGDNGLFHTEDMRVTERLRREGNTLTWQAIVEDPAVLAEPWQVNPRTLTLRTNDEIEEAAFCQDRDQKYMQDLSHHRNTR